MKLNPLRETLTYRELIEVVDTHPDIKTRLDVIGYLVSLTGGVDKLDFVHVLQLHIEGYVAE